MSTDFNNSFATLTDHEPYPWQQQLYARLVTGGRFSAIDIPTGLGKTSVMAVWLLAHLLGDSTLHPPMRLVYVVNRRTIVDQATDVAMALRDRVCQLEPWTSRFGDQSLCVSTLRGALADKYY